MMKSLVKYISIAESGSNHPVAKAVVTKFGNIGTADEITEIAGRGVKAVACGKVILAGNIKLMEENALLKLKKEKQLQFFLMELLPQIRLKLNSLIAYILQILIRNKHSQKQLQNIRWVMITRV